MLGCQDSAQLWDKSCVWVHVGMCVEAHPGCGGGMLRGCRPPDALHRVGERQRSLRETSVAAMCLITLLHGACMPNHHLKDRMRGVPHTPT